LILQLIPLLYRYGRRIAGVVEEEEEEEEAASVNTPSKQHAQQISQVHKDPCC